MKSPYMQCVGKRDGVSGCRDCCASHYKCKTKYNKCVRGCMNNGRFTTLRKRSSRRRKRKSPRNDDICTLI